MTGELYLGVDGGKSKTVCLVATGDGAIVGYGRAGNADHSTVPIGVALDNVEAAVADAMRGAGVAGGTADIGCFGLAGAVWPEDVDELSAGLVARRLAHAVIVRNDAQVALRAASADGRGIVVSAGTHVSVALRTPADDQWFSGWSSVDGPGGAEAGRRVAWAVIHAYDGRGPQTALGDEVASATGYDAEGLLRRLSRGGLTEPFLASLAPILFRVSERSGDAVADEIIDGLGREMARWIPGLRARFPADQEVDVYLTGGMFRAAVPRLETTFRATVLATTSGVRIHDSTREPVVGALLEAMEGGGVEISDPVLARIAATGPPDGLFATDTPPSARP